MKPPFTPAPSYKRPSPEMLKGQAKMYKKPLSSTPRDIVSSVVEAHKHTRMSERICDGFGNVSQAHCD